ncbi:SigE family RNA polymerase sigma factor [Micromonospora sp. CA-249363]|uniref:SigE family RNA polymerase sigma factor n=1 Tax=Micromonospora sp. CA-249363 TaxID=3239963 RepID=UPI003D8A3524
MAGRDREDDFATFVSTYSPGLLRSAWMLTGDDGRAEDLLQSSLSKAWRRWSQVTNASSPEAYVRRILYTTYVSWWRRRWHGELPSARLPEQVYEADLTTLISRREAVRAALGRLTRQQRAIVTLRYLEDLSVAETAAILNCSVGTVKVQSARAMAALRRDPRLSTYSPTGVDS